MADIVKRRKIRQLEAKRDELMEKQKRNRVELAQTRASLKEMRKK